MSSLNYATLAVIACLAGCSGEQATSGPVEDPSSVEPEPAEEATTAEEGGGEEASPEPASAEPPEEEEPAEADAPEAPKEEPPPKKACSDLDESACKVTVGCAWHSKKKCIDE